MHDDVVLCVPEVNGDALPQRTAPQIIANPNCSTIQLVVALKPLEQKFGLETVKVATYQAVSGAGKAARDELLSPPAQPQMFPHPIAYNCLPQIGSFDDDGFCGEEAKIRRETKKIFDQPTLRVSAWTVRVPVVNAHCEAVWVTLKKPADKAAVLAALEQMPGLEVAKENNYPTALQASGSDSVYVGRVHRDIDDPDTWMLWVVADNIRKGAALNGLQIAERIFDI
jgi:aspartate-semialdehyde dehydrogenase